MIFSYENSVVAMTLFFEEKERLGDADMIFMGPQLRWVEQKRSIELTNFVWQVCFVGCP